MVYFRHSRKTKRRRTQHKRRKVRKKGGRRKYRRRKTKRRRRKKRGGSFQNWHVDVCCDAVNGKWVSTTYDKYIKFDNTRLGKDATVGDLIQVIVKNLDRHRVNGTPLDPSQYYFKWTHLGDAVDEDQKIIDIQPRNGKKQWSIVFPPGSRNAPIDVSSDDDASFSPHGVTGQFHPGRAGGGRKSRRRRKNLYK